MCMYLITSRQAIHVFPLRLGVVGGAFLEACVERNIYPTGTLPCSEAIDVYGCMYSRCATPELHCEGFSQEGGGE